MNKVFKIGKFKDIFKRLTGAMFSQVSKCGKFAQTNFNEGVKRRGDNYVEAILVELSQLDNMAAFTPLMINGLSNKEKKMALNLLIFIKKKRSGKIKDRVVVDGIKQRSTVSKEDAVSPTVQLESLVILLLIDATENRDVAVSDVVGSYLLAETKYHIIVKLTGKAMDMLCKANKKYEKFVTMEKRRKVM